MTQRGSLARKPRAGDRVAAHCSRSVEDNVTTARCAESGQPLPIGPERRHCWRHGRIARRLTVGADFAVLFPGLQARLDVAAYLVERGYVAAGALPAMGVDIARLKATALPDGYEFVRIGSGPDASSECGSSPSATNSPWASPCTSRPPSSARLSRRMLRCRTSLSPRRRDCQHVGVLSAGRTCRHLLPIFIRMPG